MAIEIYWGSGSPFSWRALLTLEIKGFEYTSRLLEFSKGEHKAPAYLALNPRGKVPTLRDGDCVLCESLAIMAYLDRKRPDPPLFGRSAAETGLIWKAILEFRNYAEPAIDRIIRPMLFGSVRDSADDIVAASQVLHPELATMERAAAAQGWLAGETVSAADIASYPLTEFLLRVAGKDVAQPLGLGLEDFADRYPALDAWRGRMRELPGYERAYPPHWREAS